MSNLTPASGHVGRKERRKAVHKTTAEKKALKQSMEALEDSLGLQRGELKPAATTDPYLPQPPKGRASTDPYLPPAPEEPKSKRSKATAAHKGGEPRSNESKGPKERKSADLSLSPAPEEPKGKGKGSKGVSDEHSEAQLQSLLGLPHKYCWCATCGPKRQNYEKEQRGKVAAQQKAQKDVADAGRDRIEGWVDAFETHRARDRAEFLSRVRCSWAQEDDPDSLVSKPGGWGNITDNLGHTYSFTSLEEWEDLPAAVTFQPYTDDKGRGKGKGLLRKGFRG